MQQKKWHRANGGITHCGGYAHDHDNDYGDRDCDCPLTSPKKNLILNDNFYINRFSK